MRSRPHDVADALQRIVDSHRQMVAGGKVPSGEDDVSPQRRLGGPFDRVRPFAKLRPGDPGWRGGDRATHVEPERKLVASCEASGSFAAGERSAGSGIERGAVGIARGGSARDIRPTAEAGINEALRLEPGKRFGVVVAVFALPARLGFEAEAEPSEIVENGRLVSRLAARAVQVFNAQQQASAELGGDALVAKRRIGVAEVQRAVRRRREPQDRRGRKNVGAHDEKGDP